MPSYDDQVLYNALVELEVIDKKQLDEAYEASKANHGVLADVLLDKDLLSDENLGRTIAEIYSLPLVRLSEISISSSVLQLIPEKVAKSQQVIAFKKDQMGIHVAMVDPTNMQIIDLIEKKAQLPVVVYVATKRDMQNALFLYSKDITQEFDEIISKNVKETRADSDKLIDPPIIKIVDTILRYAYENKASDIHIEPTKDTTIIRFRIDGIMHDIAKLPIPLHKPIGTRVKVLANLRTDEHQSAQDGKFEFKADNESVYVRVSVVPITNGEKIVMRLLSEHSRQFSLLDLGLSLKDLSKVRQAYQKPYGMILSSGPTGSGKTTTVYAILKLLNSRNVNIMTIEDPVEYEIEGVNQIQVNEKTNLTFAEGLRSIVRQDPNIILVGEIRDAETADIAINSAMTGHLVLSTLHTSDATTAVPRLLDMGIEPFLVASTITIVIAQRLVRKIHNRCRVSQDVSVKDLLTQFDQPTIKKLVGTKKTIRLYYGKGCPLDHGTGFDGRVGIFEVLIIDDEIRKAIMERKDAATIRKLAIKKGMRTVLEDGIDKAVQGVTTVTEVIRVINE